MSILDPAVRLVGCLSFRHKRHVTALIFGVPRVVSLGVILAGLGGRVAAVAQKRDALAVQLPALTLLANAHPYLAARLGAVVLVNQRLKSRRRNELTLLRGNFNALVQWSMDSLQKIAREHPPLADSLGSASGASPTP